MSKEELSKVIDKIKKLFALGKSSNENEAALAIERARTIMLKYNIEQSDLIGEVEDVIEVDFALASKFNLPAISLAIAIGKGFMVNPILMKTSTGYHKAEKKIKFIGTISDIAAGTYVYSYILNLVDQKSNEYYEQIRYSKAKWTPSEAKKVRADYAYGFIQAIKVKLEAMEAERNIANPYEAEVSNALVVVKNANVQKYMDEQIGKVKNSSVKGSQMSKEHSGAGYAEGEKTGIHRGVSGRSEDRQLAIGA